MASVWYNVKNLSCELLTCYLRRKVPADHQARCLFQRILLQFSVHACCKLLLSMARPVTPTSLFSIVLQTDIDYTRQQMLGQRRRRLATINPLTSELLNFNFHPLEVVSRWRDPQLQVSENYSDLTKLRSTVFKYCWCHIWSLTCLKVVLNVLIKNENPNICGSGG